jgi:alkylation response protein AidB-like acyl-CoA dehydrogenase
MPALATGAENWCQFFSEPGAGSDLAGVQTRAVRDGDQWVVKGQKVWSSGARDADRGILVARTDTDLPKHRGISFFVIDVDQPGVELRPIRQMNGEAEFNESFFTDAVVPHANLIGGVNNGWAVTVASLMHERATYAAGDDLGRAAARPGRKPGLLDLSVREVLARQATAPRGHFAFPMGSSEAMISLAREFGRDRDPVIRQRIARLHILSEVTRFTALRAKAAMTTGRPPGPESSLGYVAGVQIARMSRDLALDILGAHAMLLGADAPRGGMVQLMALSTLSHGIQGGTEQIQRNILGERVLGLPKEPQIDRDLPFRDLKVGTQRG